MKSLELTIQGMHCDGCAATIEALLGREPGVKAASVSFSAGKGRILYDPGSTSPARLTAAVRQAGYRVATDSSSAAE
jgi:copper chaperone CopZ